MRPRNPFTEGAAVYKARVGPKEYKGYSVDPSDLEVIGKTRTAKKMAAAQDRRRGGPPPTTIEQMRERMKARASRRAALRKKLKG